jgi:hypothetical protein
MDPLTAFGFAANLLQFVDFGTKILSTGSELYKSKNGTLQANEQLDLVAVEIVEVTSKLFHDHGLGSNFQRLCSEAISLGNEIVTRLDKLKVNGKHKKWESFRQAVVVAFTKDDLQDMMTRLSRLRETLQTRILLSLRYEYTPN